MARRWWPVHHATARLHRTSNHEAAQPRYLSHAGLRRDDRRYALANSERWRLSLQRCGTVRPGITGDSVSWWAAGVAGFRGRPTSRKRAGVGARVLITGRKTARDAHE